MDIDNAEYGWHHQTAIIKLKDEYKARAERAEAALRTLVETGEGLLDRIYPASILAVEALRTALEQAQSVLPKEEAKGE